FRSEARRDPFAFLVPLDPMLCKLTGSKIGSLALRKGVARFKGRFKEGLVSMTPAGQRLACREESSAG
ncbi:hypothetical protein, partial [Burkholderia ubonensis]|uniref:hypothetical protein n=1 Tax=Burkholderia ubonensis TaxID=101571 RepID=UPI001E4CD51A